MHVTSPGDQLETDQQETREGYEIKGLDRDGAMRREGEEEQEEELGDRCKANI